MTMRLTAGILVILAACGWLAAQQQTVKKSPASSATPATPATPATSSQASAAHGSTAAGPASGPAFNKPSGMRLTYDVEWRLIHGGQAIIEERANWVQLKLESAGLVSSLYKVNDTYTANYDDPFCVTSSLLDSNEGKRHHETQVLYDRVQGHAFFVEKDVPSNAVIRSTGVDVPACVQDALGAMLKLRTAAVDPGRNLQLFVSDGRRSGSVKVEGMEREEIHTPAGSFKTVRYEANLLNGVVYTRKGRVFIWVTDNEDRRVVQVQVRMSFPIGTVTLQLIKQEPL
jgi:hypothetical protein